MIEVKLTLQPSNEPHLIDGLLWGGNEPAQFHGLTKERNGLIGMERTYLFQPICYDSPNCFEPYRAHHGMERSQTYPVNDFPDTDPFEIIKSEGDEPLIDDTGEYATAGGGLLSYLYMREQGIDFASELANSIRYAVKYPNETLRVSELIPVAHRAEDLELIERSQRFSGVRETGGTVLFGSEFKKVYMGSRSEHPIAEFSRGRSAALRYLFSRWQQNPEAWNKKDELLSAEGVPPSWREAERDVKTWLCGHQEEKIKANQRWLIAEIVDEEDSRDLGKVVRLSQKYQYLKGD